MSICKMPFIHQEVPEPQTPSKAQSRSRCSWPFFGTRQVPLRAATGTQGRDRHKGGG